MKFVIVAIALMQVLSTNHLINRNAAAAKKSKDDYTYVEDVYYGDSYGDSYGSPYAYFYPANSLYTPVSSYYYLNDIYFSPTVRYYSTDYYSYTQDWGFYRSFWSYICPTYSYYRKSDSNGKKEVVQKTDKENMRKEIEALTKEILGESNDSITDFFQKNKVYDPKWLIAQLKIARLKGLLDMVAKEEKINRKRNGNAAKDPIDTPPKPNVAKKVEATNVASMSKNEKEQKVSAKAAVTKVTKVDAKKVASAQNQVKTVEKNAKKAKDFGKEAGQGTENETVVTEEASNTQGTGLVVANTATNVVAAVATGATPQKETKQVPANKEGTTEEKGKSSSSSPSSEQQQKEKKGVILSKRVQSQGDEDNNSESEQVKEIESNGDSIEVDEVTSDESSTSN